MISPSALRIPEPNSQALVHLSPIPEMPRKPHDETYGKNRAVVRSCFVGGIEEYSQDKAKSNHITGHGGPLSCDASRFPHFPYSRFTDGGEVVSRTRLSRFFTRKIPGTHFC
jgi:hypothetical protein